MVRGENHWLSTLAQEDFPLSYKAILISCDLVYKSPWILAKSCALLIIEEAANKTKSQQLNSKFGF